MIILFWIVSYSSGLLSFFLSAYSWYSGRNRADLYFAVFLATFFFHSFFTSFYFFSRISVSDFTAMSEILVLGICVSLPLYVSVRTKSRLMGIFWKCAALISVPLLVAVLVAWLNGKQETIFFVAGFVRIFTAGVIIISMLPFFFRKKQPVSAENMPSKKFWLAGIISIVFAVLVLLPWLAGLAGIRLHIRQDLLYLVFYFVLNLRFMAFLLPKILLRKKTVNRDRMMEKFGITARESEVYNLLAKGYSYRDIARFLFISLPTVKTHIDHLYRKTGTGNKVELINELDTPGI